MEDCYWNKRSCNRVTGLHCPIWNCQQALCYVWPGYFNMSWTPGNRIFNCAKIICAPCQYFLFVNFHGRAGICYFSDSRSVVRWRFTALHIFTQPCKLQLSLSPYLKDRGAGKTFNEGQSFRSAFPDLYLLNDSCCRDRTKCALHCVPCGKEKFLERLLP